MDPAQRRFQNDQERNKAASLVGPGKNAAQGSVRPTADNRINALTQRPVAGNPSNQQPAQLNSASAPNRNPQPQPMGPSPVGGLGAPATTFDEQTENLLRKVRLEKVMQSPEAQTANTIVSLRNFWNGKDIHHDRGRQVTQQLMNYVPPDAQ